MKNMHGKKLHKSSKFWGENKGFTLVELMVVLVVMMIVAGVSAAAIINWQHHTRVQRQNENAKTIFTAASNQLTSLNAGNSLGVFTYNLKDSSGKYAKNCTPIDVRCLSDAEGTYYNNEADVWTNDATYSIVSIRTHKGDYSKLISGTLTDEESKLVFKLITDYITDGSVLNSAIAIEFSPEAGQVFAVCCSDSQDYLYYDEDFEAGQPRINERTSEALEDKLIGFFGSEGLSVEQRDPQPLISAKINARVVNDDVFGLEIFTGDEDLKGSLGMLSYEITMRQGSKKYQIKYTASSTSNYAGSKWNKVSVTINPYRTETALETNASKIKTIDIPAKTVISGGMEHLYLVLDGVDIQAQTWLCNVEDKSSSYYKRIDENAYSFVRLISCLGMSQENITFEIDKITGQSVTNQNVDISDGDIEYPESNESNTVASSPMFGSRNVSDNALYTISNIRHFYNIRYIEECLPEYFEIEDSETRLKSREYLITADLDWQGFIDSGYLFNSFANGNGMVGFPTESGAINITSESNIFYPSYKEISAKSTIHSVEGDLLSFSNANIDYRWDVTYGIIGTRISETEYDDNDENSAGLIILNKGNVESLIINNINVRGKNATGSLCACNEGKINDITVTGNGSVAGGRFTGGLVGINTLSADVKKIKIDTDITVTGKNFTGGLAGFNRSKNFGEVDVQPKAVTGYCYVGGIYGGNITSLTDNVTLTVEEGHIPAYICGYSFVGGVIGYNSLSSSEDDIEQHIMALDEAVEGHDYEASSYNHDNDFKVNNMALTSVVESTGKKLNIITTKENGNNSDYKPIIIQQYTSYNENNGENTVVVKAGMAALSHAGGVIGFNSKYSDVVIECPVEADIRGEDKEYTFQQVDYSNVKYQLIRGRRTWFGFSAGTTTYDLTWNQSQKCWTYVKENRETIGLKCLNNNLGTTASNGENFTYKDVDYLAQRRMRISAYYSRRWFNLFGYWIDEISDECYIVKTGSELYSDPEIKKINKGEYYGGVVAENYGTITQNGDVTATLRGERQIGGVIAENNAGAILNIACDVEVDIKSERQNTYTESSYIDGLNAGGLVARNSGEIVNTREENGERKFVNIKVAAIEGQSYAGGAVAVNDSTKILALDRINIYPKDKNALIDVVYYCVGGVVGSAITDINITNCINQVDVRGKYCSGGIVGHLYGNADSYVTNCYNSGHIESEAQSAGGIIGLVPVESGMTSVNNIYITSCVNAGYIDAPDGQNPSGIVCSTSGKGTINSCRNYGTRSGGGELAAGITAGDTKKIAYCLDGTKKTNNSHFSPYTSKGYLNFYFGEEELLKDDRYRVVSHQAYGYYNKPFNSDYKIYFNTERYKLTDDYGVINGGGTATSKPCHMTDLSGNIISLSDYLLDKPEAAYQNPDETTYPYGIGNWNLHSDKYNGKDTYLIISNEVVDEDGKFLPTRVNDISIVWNNTTYGITSANIISQKKMDMLEAINNASIYSNQTNLSNMEARWNSASYKLMNNQLETWGIHSIETVFRNIYSDSTPTPDMAAYRYKQAINNYFGGDIDAFIDYAHTFYIYDYIDYSANGSNVNYYHSSYWADLLQDLESTPTNDADINLKYEYQIQVKAVDGNGNVKNRYYYRECTLNSNEPYKIATLNLSETNNVDGDAIDISKIVMVNVELRGITTNVSTRNNKASIRALWWTPADKTVSEPMNREIPEEIPEIDFVDAIWGAVLNPENVLTSYKEDDDTYYVRVKGARTGIKDLNQDPSPVSNDSWTKDIGCYGMEFEDEDKNYIKFLENIKNSGVTLAVQPSLEQLPSKDEYIHN